MEQQTTFMLMMRMTKTWTWTEAVNALQQLCCCMLHKVCFVRDVVVVQPQIDRLGIVVVSAHDTARTLFDYIKKCKE